MSADAEAQEFLRDVNEIARVRFDAAEADEEDGRAYCKIVEYPRLGILLLRQALRQTSSVSVTLILT